MSRITFALLFLISSISNAFAAQDFAECKQFFVNGAVPVASNHPNTRALCFDEFAVLHSGQSKTPVYVAERLSKEKIDSKVKRAKKFFADARLPRTERAELDDYKSSGYDRGHMAPAGDMSTNNGMAQCFSLANMVPQNPKNNQKMWNSIEVATRKYIQRAASDVYVITGPVFDRSPETIGQNHVWVPTYLYKLVYDPTTKKAWAHWIENTDTARVTPPISYEELVKRTGIRFLPDGSVL
ncbi:DNA/RNA non-specific endonuclease [Undibacterium crateris]|uniref:DNA/RNA non-specific endonuclease n=1 Tax=Undibacterium crateris TaxID=2528175 RepID=UPI001389743F|nr:DNA/RNA non-specific endonuclease [Undibacterium crateris]NDI85484.1 DNA/RNA non-specific endonuclease [Undibacterium crateris]